MDPRDDHLSRRPGPPTRPLLGLTILAVEDSRYASEALRLLAARSGARLRRADRLDHAHRHLRAYRPGCILIDLGLPDGSGTALIAELAAAQPRVEIILGMSGDPGGEDAARAAGADGFLAKPIVSLGAFQAAILRHMAPGRVPPGPQPLPDSCITPDPIAYRDDLARAAAALDGEEEGPGLDYVTQFLGGVARSAGDAALAAAVAALAEARQAGRPVRPDRARLAAAVRDRLVAAPPL
jgi:CheY-like chemotaxis protein